MQIANLKVFLCFFLKLKTHAAGFSEASENTFKVADNRCNLLIESILKNEMQPAISCLRLP